MKLYGRKGGGIVAGRERQTGLLLGRKGVRKCTRRAKGGGRMLQKGDDKYGLEKNSNVKGNKLGYKRREGGHEQDVLNHWLLPGVI